MKVSKYLLILLAVAAFMQMLESTVLNTALPKIAKELGESPLKMQSVIIAYTLTMAMVMPLSGFFCDKFGTKITFTSSLTLFVLGSLFCACSFNLASLVFSRVIQGAGASMLMPVQRLILLRSYNRDELLGKINLVIIPALIGPILGPMIGGFLVDNASWQWIFLINLPLGIIGITSCFFILPDYRAEKAPSLDKKGLALFSFGACFLTLSAEAATNPKFYLLALCLFLTGLVLAFFYRKHSKKAKQPIYPLELWKLRTFRLGLLGNLFSRLGMGAVPFLIPLFLQLCCGFSASKAGMFLVPMAAANLFAKIFITKIVKKAGYRKLLITNTMAIGFLLMGLSLLNQDSPALLILSFLLVIGLCNSVQFSAMNMITLSKLRNYHAASANSLIAVNQHLGLTFGIAISAISLNLLTQELALTTIKAFKISFIILGVLTLCATRFFSLLHKRDGENLIGDR